MILGNKKVVSPEKTPEIIFGEMSEQRMGSAYSCDIYLNTEGEKPLLLHERSTGSALWNSKNSSVYFTLWTDTKKGLMQQLAAYSVAKNQITIFDTLYNVLNLESMDGHFIKAIENPYSKPKTIVLDIEKEKIGSQIHWTSLESDTILLERQKYLATRTT